LIGIRKALILNANTSNHYYTASAGKLIIKQSLNPEANNFSIVLGGPFFQLLCKAHLTGDALELIKKRTLIITMIA